MRPTVRGPRRVTIYQSCLRLSAVIRNGTRYMSISVAVPFRQLRRIAKSAAVPSPSRVAEAGVRRVRSIGRPDRYVRPGWVALPATTRLEEFAHCARRSSFQRRCGSDGPVTAGPTAAHFYLQHRLSASILSRLPVRPYTRAVIAPFCLHHPSYLHPRSSDSTPALGPPSFLQSLLVSMSKVWLIRK
jgi:hypothetical protein